MKWLRFLVSALALYCLAAWQQSEPGQGGLLGYRLEPLLALVFVIAVRVRPGVAALTGFFAGLLMGAPAGADLTAWTAPLALVAFLASMTPRLGVQALPVTVAVVAALGTLACRVAAMFLAPPPDIGRFLAATMATAIFNGVLAGLLDALSRRTLDPQVD